MLQILRNYTKKIEEKKYPPAPIPSATLLLVIGDRMREEMNQILPVFQKRWPNDIQNRLRICFLDRETEPFNQFAHYMIQSDINCSIAESKKDIAQINSFFRTECNEMLGKGNQIQVVSLTCANDVDAVRSVDITAIAKKFCIENITPNVRAYQEIFMPFSVKTSSEDKYIQSFFEQAMKWETPQYKTEPIFCKFEDSEPEPIIASNNGLIEGMLVLDARDENNNDLTQNSKRAQMLANTLEFTDLFDIRESYLQIVGDQPAGVGYEFVLADALSKERWEILPPANPKLMKLRIEESMKEAAASSMEELPVLLNCAAYAYFNRQYEEQGMIITAGKSLHSLEKDFFGDVLLDLYQQWETKLLKMPLPPIFAHQISDITSLDEIHAISEQIKKILEIDVDRTFEDRNYNINGGIVEDLQNPWDLRTLISQVYLNTAERSRKKLLAVWAQKYLDLLDEKQLQLEREQHMVDEFFARCSTAITELKNIWKSWNYNGPNMRVLEADDKLKLRRKIIQCMQADDSDFEDVIVAVEEYVVDAYPENVNRPNPTYYCRLNTADLHGGVMPRTREIKKGLATGTILAFYEPKTVGEIHGVRLITKNC